MIGRQRIDAGFDIRKVLPKQGRHIGKQFSPVGDRPSGSGPRTRGFAVLRCLRGEPAHREPVAQVPGDARQLRRPVSGAGDQAGQRVGQTLRAWRDSG